MSTRLLEDDAEDRALREQVRPSDWVNPPAAPRYHLVVLGGGTAGLVCAAGAAGLGARVALIEQHLLGGDCLNSGCVPSKSLLAAAQQAPGDFPAAMQRLRRQRAQLAKHDSAERFRSLGVDVFFGTGQFVGPDRVEVAGQTLRFRKAVIATGSRPQRPNIPGIESYVTHEELFTLAQRPTSMNVIGAGPIGCEMAQAFARFGTRVNLIDRAGRVLPREDQDAAEMVLQSLQCQGVSWVSTPDPAADCTLVAVGRLPNLEQLNLAAAGVRLNAEGRLIVDDFLRTTNAHIFVAGDVATRFAFTHAADAMARLVIRNALFGGWGRWSQQVIPWCTYTDPEIGRVGLSRAEAQAQGVAVDEYTHRFEAVDRAVLEGETSGFVRVLTQRGRDRILGITAVGYRAGELLGLAAFALAQGKGLGDFAQAIFPYPTRNEVLRKLGDAYNRTRLTPWTRWLLRWWMGPA
jgi:pyruvate/2-oxoglutarate dehydrogenase complex dihydrolipoamide dehydrogenase (E3) component